MKSNKQKESAATLNRRDFIRTTAAGTVAASGVLAQVPANAANTKTKQSQTDDRYQQVLARCGSEFGDIKHSE